MDYSKEFNSFYTRHLHKPSSNIDYYNQQISSSLTPYVLETREMRATQIDIFSRLMMDRIIWIAGEINDNTSNVVQAQLMFLESYSNEKITLHIDSPGGSVKSGLSIIDVIDFINSDVHTVNMGMAASMASVILGSGKKSNRATLKHSRTMIHQSSSGFNGNFQDAKIYMNEWQKMNELILDLLSVYCDKTVDQLKNDSNRDFWLDSKESVSYGIVDFIVTTKKEMDIK